MRRFLILIAASAVLCAQIQTGPALPYRAVEGWAQLPPGWNFGEVSAVDVDRSDNVWVFSDGPHPVIEFDRSGRFLQAWPEFLGKKPHGLRVGPDGNIWTVDLETHRVMKWTPEDLGVVQGLYYVKSEAVLYMCDLNARILKVNLDGKVLGVIGSFGKSPGKLDIPHYLAVDSTGAVYVADFRNWRVEKFVAK